MKIDNIVILPSGFTPLTDVPVIIPPPPPPPPPPPGALGGLFVATQEYTDDFSDVIFAFRCLDPVTGEVLGTFKNTDVAAPKSDGNELYQFYGCKVVGDAVYLMAKGSNNGSMNTHGISLGPAATIDHDSASPGQDYTWALIKFTTQDLSDPEEIILWHPDGNYYATSASGGSIPAGATYETYHSILEVLDSIAYTHTIKVLGTGGPDNSGCDSGYDRFAISGYALADGQRMTQDDLGPVGVAGVKRVTHPWCIGGDGTLYSVGTGRDFVSGSNPPHMGQLWSGIPSDPFQTLIYDGGGTTGPGGTDADNRLEIVWLCADPDSGDIFLYWLGQTVDSPQSIDRIDSTGALLDTYELSTTEFVNDWSQSTGVAPAMVARNGKLYCSTDMSDGSTTIEGGIWVIDVATGAGQGDPAYYFGGPGGGSAAIPTDVFYGFFGEALIYGMHLASETSTGGGGGGGGGDVGAAPPPAGGYFELLPPGSTLPGGMDPTAADEAAAAMIFHSTWEPRPSNNTPNHTIVGNNLDTLDGSFDATWQSVYLPRVTGNFTGTTDEIIQWAAAKWGWSDELIRAEAIAESNWFQSQLGDYEPASAGHRVFDRSDDPSPTSFSIIQIRWYYHPPTTAHGGTVTSSSDPGCSYPAVVNSTALALDYFMCILRGVYDGHSTYLNGGGMAAAGDEWGAIGSWYSGAWHTPAAEGYISTVEGHLASKPWLDPGFPE